MYGIARLIGLDKNVAAISANQAVAKITGANVLQLLGQTHLETEKQELYHTPTELGTRIAVTGRGFNAMLAEAGFQTKLGGKAFRAGIGEILLDHRAAQTSMAHGGATKYKKVAVAAVKDVIERGALVHQSSTPEEDSFYFSALVDIDGVTNIETVLVHRDVNTKRMYMHSVTTKENLLSLPSVCTCTA